jgi:hypothetical protein
MDAAASSENVTSAPARLQSQKRPHPARCISTECYLWAVYPLAAEKRSAAQPSASRLSRCTHPAGEGRSAAR